jgi:hypothetical protein
MVLDIELFLPSFRLYHICYHHPADLVVARKKTQAPTKGCTPALAMVGPTEVGTLS